MRILVLPPLDVSFPAESPWRAVLGGLRSCGHEIDDFGVVSGTPDGLVSLNDQPAARAVVARHDIPPQSAALLVLEPQVTSPSMYLPRSLHRYAHRFAASPHWAAAIGGEDFRWPQSLETGHGPVQPQAFRATMVNGDKRSAVPGSLYGLRRLVIRACAEQDVSLGLFGPGWGDSTVHRGTAGAKCIVRAMTSRRWPNVGEALSDLRFRPGSWQGSVESKPAALALAPMTIVIENSADYVSEKLIDAICAGAAPVYVGPALSDFDLPDDIAIRVAPRASDIVDAVAMASEGRIREVRQAGAEWLQSSGARRHDIQQVLYNLGQTIGARLG